MKIETEFEDVRSATNNRNGLADVIWLAMDAGYSCTFDQFGTTNVITLTKQIGCGHHCVRCMGDTIDEAVESAKEFFRKQS